MAESLALQQRGPTLAQRRPEGAQAVATAEPSPEPPTEDEGGGMQEALRMERHTIVTERVAADVIEDRRYREALERWRETLILRRQEQRNEEGGIERGRTLTRTRRGS